MIIVGVGLGIVVALLRGGKIDRLGDLGIKGLPLVWVALLLRTMIGVLGSRGFNLPWFQVIAYLLFFYVLALNLAWPGLKLFSLGSLLNFLVIAANGGAMPVSPQAIAFARLSGDPSGKHTLLTEASRLWFLADIIPLRPPYFPVAQIISVGDILIVAGIFIYIQHKMLQSQAPAMSRVIGL